MDDDEDRRLLWLVLKANGGFSLELADMQDYPGDDALIMVHRAIDGVVKLEAITAPVSEAGKPND